MHEGCGSSEPLTLIHWRGWKLRCRRGFRFSTLTVGYPKVACVSDESYFANFRDVLICDNGLVKITLFLGMAFNILD